MRQEPNRRRTKSEREACFAQLPVAEAQAARALTRQAPLRPGPPRSVRCCSWQAPVPMCNALQIPEVDQTRATASPACHPRLPRCPAVSKTRSAIRVPTVWKGASNRRRGPHQDRALHRRPRPEFVAIRHDRRPLRRPAVVGRHSTRAAVRAAGTLHAVLQSALPSSRGGRSLKPGAHRRGGPSKPFRPTV
jgi:hypothetical protein